MPGKRSYKSSIALMRWKLTFSQEDQFLTVGLKHPSLCFQELQDLRDIQSHLLVAAAMLKSSFAVIEGIEACCRGVMDAKTASSAVPRPTNAAIDDASLSPELQSITTLGLKCKGYLQSVDLIQHRLSVITGLVRIIMLVIGSTLTPEFSFLTASTNIARRLPMISPTTAMH